MIYIKNDPVSLTKQRKENQITCIQKIFPNRNLLSVFLFTRKDQTHRDGSPTAASLLLRVCVHIQPQTHRGIQIDVHMPTHTRTNKPRRRTKKSDQMRGRLLRCGSSPGRRGLSPHAESVAAAESNVMKVMMCLGPHPEVSIKMWPREAAHSCLSVCVYVCKHTDVYVKQGERQHSGLLSSKTMISIKCRCFVQLECLQQNPSSLFS